MCGEGRRFSTSTTLFAAMTQLTHGSPRCYAAGSLLLLYASPSKTFARMCEVVGRLARLLVRLLACLRGRAWVVLTSSYIVMAVRLRFHYSPALASN